MNAIQNLAEHAQAISTGDIIEHQREQLAKWERIYSAAVQACDYDATQYAAKACNRIRTALVMHGAMASVYDADREARQLEDASNS